MVKSGIYVPSMCARGMDVTSRTYPPVKIPLIFFSHNYCLTHVQFKMPPVLEQRELGVGASGEGDTGIGGEGDTGPGIGEGAIDIEEGLGVNTAGGSGVGSGAKVPISDMTAGIAIKAMMHKMTTYLNILYIL